MKNANYRLIFCILIAITLASLTTGCQKNGDKKIAPTPQDTIAQIVNDYIADTTAFKLKPHTNSRVAVVDRAPTIDTDLDYSFVSACGGKDKAIMQFKAMFAEVQGIYAKVGIKIALKNIRAFESEQADYYHGSSLETLSMVNACQINNYIYAADHKGLIHYGSGGGMSKTIDNNYYFACAIPTTFTPGKWSIAIECLVHELGHQFGLPHSHELYHPITIGAKTYTSQAYDYFGTFLGYNNGALESRDFHPVPLNTTWMYPDSCLVMSYGHLDNTHKPRRTYSFTAWEIALMKQSINARTDIGTDGVSVCKNDVQNFTYDGAAYWTGLFNSSWNICYGITVPGNTKFNDWQAVPAEVGVLRLYPSGWNAFKYTNGSSVTTQFTGNTTATVNDGLRFETSVPISLDNYTTLTETTTLPAGTAYASSVWLNGVTKGKTVYGIVGQNGTITIKLSDYGTGLSVNRFHVRGDKYTGNLNYSVSNVYLQSKSGGNEIKGSFSFPSYPSGTKLTVKIRPTCNAPQEVKANTYYITTK